MKSINHQVREAQIRNFETLKKEANASYYCIDCGWKGVKSQLGGWIRFMGVAEFCPACGLPDFLVSGGELDAMNHEDKTCQLATDLNSRTAS